MARVAYAAALVALVALAAGVNALPDILSKLPDLPEKPVVRTEGCEPRFDQNDCVVVVYMEYGVWQQCGVLCGRGLDFDPRDAVYSGLEPSKILRLTSDEATTTLVKCLGELPYEGDAALANSGENKGPLGIFDSPGSDIVLPTQSDFCQEKYPLVIAAYPDSSGNIGPEIDTVGAFVACTDCCKIFDQGVDQFGKILITCAGVANNVNVRGDYDGR